MELSKYSDLRSQDPGVHWEVSWTLGKGFPLKAFANAALCRHEAMKETRVQLKEEQFSVVPWYKGDRYKLKFRTLQRDGASQMGALKQQPRCVGKTRYILRLPMRANKL